MELDKHDTFMCEFNKILPVSNIDTEMYETFAFFKAYWEMGVLPSLRKLSRLSFLLKDEIPVKKNQADGRSFFLACCVLFSDRLKVLKKEILDTSVPRVLTFYEKDYGTNNMGALMEVLVQNVVDKKQEEISNCDPGIRNVRGKKKRRKVTL